MARGVALNEKFPFNLSTLVAPYGNLGELDQARAALAKFLALFPRGEYGTIAKFRTRARFTSANPILEAQRERYLYPGLRKAGLPEE